MEIYYHIYHTYSWRSKENLNFLIYLTYIFYYFIFLSPSLSFADIVCNADCVIERLVDIEEEAKVVLTNTKKA